MLHSGIDQASHTVDLLYRFPYIPELILKNKSWTKYKHVHLKEYAHYLIPLKSQDIVDTIKWDNVQNVAHSL